MMPAYKDKQRGTWFASFHYKDWTGKDIHKYYLKTLNAQLAALFNFAIRNYGLTKNPCSSVKSIGKTRNKEMNFWTKEQYDQFIEHEDKPSFRVFFDVLFYTGLRSGEALALTYDDILPSKRIDVNKNFAVVDGFETFLTPKNEASVRSVSIPDFLYDELQEYVNGLYGYQTDERIFYFTKSGIQKEIHRVAKLAGLPEIRVHDLRHSHASLLVHMGVDIMEISRRLGHGSVKLTWDVYSHLYPKKDIALAERLNELRRNDPEPSNDEIEEEVSGDE